MNNLYKKHDLMINNEINNNKIHINNINNKNDNNYRKTILNIDSKNRNLIPKNVLSNTFYLTENPLFFISGSSEIIIFCNNHNLQEEDRIVINYVNGQTFYLNNALIFNNNDPYITIYHPNHNLLDLINSQMYSDIYINISGIIGNQTNGTFYNNIPINLLNNKWKIYTKKPNGSYNNNYYYILSDLLPDFTESYNNMITIYFENIHGIPINGINANYPITISNLQGYQIVSNIYDENFFSINVKFYANNSSYQNIKNDIYNKNYDNFISYGLGGNKINIAKIIDFIEGYPNSNNFVINLNKNFYNVYKIKFLSSEIPNTEKTIRNYPTNKQNNLFYWQILNDGNYIYSIEITPGNYTISSLISEMTKQIQSVSRINSNLTTNIKSVDNYYSIFSNNSTEITIDSKTNIFSISMYNQISVDNAVLTIGSGTNNKYTQLQIIHPNHGLNVGDTILLSNILSFNKIPSSILNNTFTISSIIDSSNYIVNLGNYSNNGSLTQTVSGTDNIIRSPIYFRLLFDKLGTIGNILGFKNIGDQNSYTKYSYIIKNIGNLYTNIYDININLNGDNYIILSNPLFKNAITTGSIQNSFVKLFLSAPPGCVIYNSFIQITEELSIVESSLNQLEFYFYDRYGELYDFNGMDNSFTIEIYELI